MARTRGAREFAHESGDDVIAGLGAVPKTLPCRLLYDARGAELFEQICELDDYYLTRSELGLLAEHVSAIAAIAGPRARVIEPGSGAGRKTRRLLAALDRPASYIPIDVSVEQLQRTAAALRSDFPGVDIVPVHADFTTELELAGAPPVPGRSVVFFPGSTLGNVEPDAAVELLARFARLAGPRAVLVLGADSNRDPVTLLRAYDDPQGVTASFDLNVLAHVNRTHHGTFVLDRFRHRAAWNPACSRIEMHLVSQCRQRVAVAGTTVGLERGERIVTEHSYKHRHETIRGLCGTAGWTVQYVFSDVAGRMSLWIATTA